jgi:hypothetical protein
MLLPSDSNLLKHFILADCTVDELTNRLVAVDYIGESSSETLYIRYTIGVGTTTVEGDANLTVLDVADGLDGAGVDVGEHNKKKQSEQVGVFRALPFPCD